METIKINLNDRSYNIYVGEGLHSNENLFLKHVQDKNIAIITNSTVAPLYLDKIEKCFKRARLILKIILDDGEQFKSKESLDKIYESLLKNKFGRDSVLVALGGGVIGDITGYAAATYMRGIDFLQLPTTLLSQVDSSVGGKTGINHPLGKNMIGAFHQPKAVIIDTESLNTLPDSELSAGLAEVIKYGLIRDINFFSWLEINIKNLLDRKPEYLKEAIVRSCQNKASVVAEDEFETDKGIRAMLNLGHTFGHAIEAALGYGVWLHGQAVAVGIVMAAFVSMRHGWLNIKDFNRIKQIFLNAKLPTNPPDISKELFLDLMGSDKKNKDGKINLVLIKKIGQAFLTKDFSNEILSETLNKKIF